ncbi:MAG: TRAP transporter substrate-binding protein DctP, partial [Pseudomonadota bacterium]
MRRTLNLAKVLVVVMAALLLLPALSKNAAAKTYTLTFGSAGPIDPLAWGKTSRDFFCPEVVKRVKAKTGDEIKFNLAFAGAICKAGECLEATEMNLVDMALVYPIFENPKLFIHNFSYFAPFGTNDVLLATKINQSVYDSIPYLKEVFEKKYNQKFVGSFTYSTYNLLTKFPFTKIEDLKNRKIAAAGPNLPWITKIGCVPVQGSVMDAYTGLQTGLHEGWLLLDHALPAWKLTDHAKYLTYVDFGCISAGVITVNLKIWKSLPKPIQDIMLEVGREWALETAKMEKKWDEDAVGKMKQA